MGLFTKRSILSFSALYGEKNKIKPRRSRKNRRFNSDNSLSKNFVNFVSFVVSLPKFVPYGTNIGGTTDTIEFHSIDVLALGHEGKTEYG